MDGDDQQRRFPPMAISDLIVLTLCVSVAFAFNAGDFQDGLKLYVIKWHDILPDLIDVFVSGLCLFGVIVLARQAIRKDPTEIAPGHVLMGTIGPLQVCALIAGVFRPFYAANEPSVPQAIEYGVWGVLFGLSLFYPICTYRKLDLRWRVVVCFLMLAIGLGSVESGLDAAVNLGLVTIFHRGHVLTMIGNADAFTLAAISVALAIDLRGRVHRDWFHYLGVLALTLHASAELMHWQRLMARWWQALYDHIAP